MGERADRLADRFAAANNDLITTVDGIPEEDWQTIEPETGWTVGVVAHHVAYDHELLSDLATKIATGAEVPALTMEMVDQINAQHADEYADCTKEETLDLLRSNGEAAHARIAGLDDEELDMTADITVMGDQPVSAERFIEALVIGHIGMHLPAVKAAVEDRSTLEAPTP